MVNTTIVLGTEVCLPPAKCRRAYNVPFTSQLQVVDKLKHQIVLSKQMIAQNESEIDRLQQANHTVAKNLENLQEQLSCVINAPPPDNEDHTLRLPDEMLLKIVLMWCVRSDFHSIVAVCRRWRRLACLPSVQKVFQQQLRLDGYANGFSHPKTIQGHNEVVVSLALADDNRLFSVSIDTTIKVWQKSTTTSELVPIQTLTSHTDGVRCVALSNDDRLFSASYDRTIRVWSSKDYSHLQTLVGHEAEVYSLAVSDDCYLYSGSVDKTVRVWSPTCKHITTLVGHTDVVVSLNLSNDGRLLFSGSYDKTIRVWRTANIIADQYQVEHKSVAILSGHTDRVYALVSSSDGRLFSGSVDKTIRVWSTIDYSCLAVLVGHESAVISLALSDDGRLYSGSVDKTIRVWAHEDGYSLQQILPGHQSGVWSLAVSNDGQLYSGSYDKTIRVW